MNSKIPTFRDYGGYIGAFVSGTFLVLIGAPTQGPVGAAPAGIVVT